ncbi:unnamed protein product, partial [Prunus brigantina]
VAGNRSAFGNTRRKSPTTPQCTFRKSPFPSSVCSQKLKYLILPYLPPFYRTSLASGTETSQILVALPTHVTHAQGSPSSSLTSRAERQARSGRVFTHLSCQTVGTHRSCLHSPLMSNGRRAEVEFSLTSRAERQTCIGRVLTHLSCRTPGSLPHPFCAGSITFGSVCCSLPTFKTTPWLEDLGDYMITTGLQTTNARSRVRMPELRDTSKSPTKKSLLDRKLLGLQFVPYLTTHSRRDTWNALKPETNSKRPYRMFSRHSLPIQKADCAPPVPNPNLRQALPRDQPSRQSD